MSSSDKDDKQSQKGAHYSWEDTELKYGTRSTISIKDLKQLLITRGEQKKNLKGNKSKLVKLLKEKHVIELKNNIKDLTCSAILVELKIRGLNCKNAKKAVLISRLQSFTAKTSQNKNNDKKINKPQIPWQHTEIDTFSVSELKKLLIARMHEKPPNNETALIQLLKQKYRVQLSESILSHLTCPELRTELQLNGASKYHYRYSKKAELIVALKEKIQHKIARRKWIYIQWNKNSFNCQSIPSSIPYYISQPISLNFNEYFVASKTGLRKYNISENKWNMWISYGNEEHLYSAVCCLNKINKLIYVLGSYSDSKLLIINYETKNIYPVMDIEIVFRDSSDIRIFFAHEQLHVIGIYSYEHSEVTKHFIFDAIQKQFNVCHEFDTKILEFELVNLSTRNEVLLISWGVIYSYSTTSHKWTELSLKVPTGSCYDHLCCVPAGNDKFVIICGRDGDYIDVIDMECMILMHCSIRCPFKKNRAVIVNDKMKDELISFGYVRDCFKSEEIGMNVFPPQYIIQLIQLWCSQEFIHLFSCQWGWNTGLHCKISVSDIINDAMKPKSV